MPSVKRNGARVDHGLSMTDSRIVSSRRLASSKGRSRRATVAGPPSHSSLPGLKLMVAKGGLRSSALQFRRRLFEKEQGTEGLDEFDNHAVQLVGSVKGEIVAAARLVEPGRRPFGLEQYFDLAVHLGKRERVAELSRYCLHEEWRDIVRGTVLHLGMLKLAILYAQARKIESVVGSVQPRFRALYERVYFKSIGPSFHHPIFGHTTIMLLRLGAGQWAKAHPLRTLIEDSRIPEVHL